MDLEAVWQEHKKFIVSVGVGALAFGILSAGVGGIEASAESTARRNARAHADLLQSTSGLTLAEAGEKGKKIALEEKAAPAILKSITWNVDKAYILSEDEIKNPSIAYARRATNAAEEVGKKANKTGAQIQRKADTQNPNLELEEGSSLEGLRAVEAMARVDLTRRIVLAALDAGVMKVIAIRHPEASYTPLEGGAGFLRRIPVTLVFEGSAQELARLLATFQQNEGSFLEVGACRVTRAKDSRPEDGRLDIDVELAALTVEKAAPEGSESPGPGREPIRRPRPQRRDR